MKLTRGEINLYVSDLDRAADFYVMALDFEALPGREEVGPSYRKVQSGEIVLTFFLAGSPGPAPATGTQPCMTTDLHVDDLDEAHRRLAAAGAEVSDITDWPGGRFMTFRDLDGLGWELLSP